MCELGENSAIKLPRVDHAHNPLDNSDCDLAWRCRICRPYGLGAYSGVRCAVSSVCGGGRHLRVCASSSFARDIASLGAKTLTVQACSCGGIRWDRHAIPRLRPQGKIGTDTFFSYLPVGSAGIKCVCPVFLANDERQR